MSTELDRELDKINLLVEKLENNIDRGLDSINLKMNNLSEDDLTPKQRQRLRNIYLRLNDTIDEMKDNLYLKA